ncbi:MAG TPA: ABC transporter permease, partial [Bryobacteraceae bacterium]
MSELKIALRSLRRARGYSLVVVLTLALGVGANTAIFTLVNRVLWSQLPYHDAERLVSIWSSRTDRDKSPLSITDFEDFRRAGTHLADAAVFAPIGMNLTGTGEPERLQGVRSTANVFETLGVAAARGRVLMPADDGPNASRVVVLSWRLWQRRFGGDDRLIGRSLLLNGESHEVVGVLPKEFFFPIREADFVVPLQPGTNPRRRDRGDHFLTGVGRLRPGATAESVEMQLAAEARQLQREYPTTNAKNNGARVGSLGREIVGNVRIGLLVLSAAAALLLLMACASLANLSLARASARRREFAIRGALGAGWLRLARQAVTEALIASMAGAVAAVLVAHWTLRLLLALSPSDLPMLEGAGIDAGSLACNFALAAA